MKSKKKNILTILGTRPEIIRLSKIIPKLDKEFKNMIIDFQEWKKIRMIGSAAMASVYVASGKAETYKENGIFLWDIAAGAAIVNAAGGLTSIENLQPDFRVDAKFTNSNLGL